MAPSILLMEECVQEINSNLPLQGLVAVVTGAAGGIGLACAQYALAAGATVVMADKDAARGEAAAVKLDADYPSKAEFVRHDVTDEAAWQRLMDGVLARHGRLDVLVNNAGVCLPGRLQDASFEDFKRMTSVNVDGTFLGAKAAILAMRSCAAEGEPARGAIVNISSIAGQTALAGVGGYCATKAAITNMTRALAVECAERREFIRINSVHPGTVRTPLTEGIYGADYFEDSAHFSPMPLKDFARPEDIAAAVIYLASEESRMVTGSDLTIDGGFTAGIAGEF